MLFSASVSVLILPNPFERDHDAPQSCPVLTARVRILSAMARLGKASTGPGAESNTVPVVPPAGR